MTKGNSLAAMLVGVLTLVALVNLWCACTYNLDYLSWRRLQAKVTTYTNNRTLMQMLANELVEYSRRNPAIDPLLQSAGLKPTSAPAAAPAGTRKPATR